MASASAPGPDVKRELLRHTLATVAYRAAKALRDSPPGFENFKASSTSRTPGEILAHMGDLYDWALSLVQGKEQFRPSTPLAWSAGTARFFAALEAFDAYLASSGPLGESAERVFQGPIADSLNHVGQIAMLRRMAGAPIRGESYYRAIISSGRVGSEQAAPVREFA